METITYQLTIKKEYAWAILEDLMLNEAIEFKPNNIPAWQILESRKRLAKMKANPSSMINSEDSFNCIMDDL
jgi:hypothetical protein